MGIVNTLTSKLDNLGHTFANPLATLTGRNDKRDTWYDNLNYKLSSPAAQVRPAIGDAGKFVTTLAQDTGIKAPDPLPPPDPNAPGSIFAPRQYGGPPPNMPAPGTPTNGLAGGSMSGGIDWAPIIARALRKS